jgi:hypothetical protein
VSTENITMSDRQDTRPCAADPCEYHGTCHCECPCMPDFEDNCSECKAHFGEVRS